MGTKIRIKIVVLLMGFHVLRHSNSIRVSSVVGVELSIAFISGFLLLYWVIHVFVLDVDTISILQICYF